MILRAVAMLLIVATAGGGLAAQQASLTVFDILLAADRMRADRWYPAATTISDPQAITGSHNRGLDMDLLLLGTRHPDPEIRGTAVRELGRFETPANVPHLAIFLEDPVFGVRVLAANALVQTTYNASAEETLPAVKALEHRLIREFQSLDRWYLWMALAELPLPTPLADRLEREWVDIIEQTQPLAYEAASALLTLARRSGERRLSGRTEAAVVSWAEAGLSQGEPIAMAGTKPRGSTLTFLEIALALRTDDQDLPMAAARFTCRRSTQGCSYAIRRFGLEHLNPKNPLHVPALESAARERIDPRLTDIAIRKLLTAPDAAPCRLLERAAGLQVEVEVLRSLATFETHVECPDWDVDAVLMQHASRLVGSSSGTTWVLPMAAMETLAKRGEVSEAFTEIVRGAAIHSRWPVRAAAARAATMMKHVETLVGLLATDQPVVKAEALRGLFALKSPVRWNAAVDALQYPDAHLVITTMGLIAEPPDPIVMRDAIFAAMTQMTRDGRDTSRRARLALLQGLAPLLPGPQHPDVAFWISRVQPWLRDFDPQVAEAAAVVLSRMTENTHVATPTRRAAHQPTLQQLTTLPPCFTLTLDDTREWTIVFARESAPLAVARFLTDIHRSLPSTMFHRVTDRLVVGGSREGHDEGGLQRFIRDEVYGTGATVAAVLLGHDRDELDGRFAIRYAADASHRRRETALGSVIGFSDVVEWTTISRAWVGASEPRWRASCNTLPGIPSILRRPGSFHW